MHPRSSPSTPYPGIDEPMSGSVLVTGGAGFFGRIPRRFLPSHLEGLDREYPSAHRRPSRMRIIRLLKPIS